MVLLKLFHLVSSDWAACAFDGTDVTPAAIFEGRLKRTQAMATTIRTSKRMEPITIPVIFNAFIDCLLSEERSFSRCGQIYQVQTNYREMLKQTFNKVNDDIVLYEIKIHVKTPFRYYSEKIKR
jgi:hypothetical protein